MFDDAPSTALRERLRAKIATRDAAAERWQEAGATAGRAKQLLEDATTRLAGFAGLDTRIAEHRAEAIRSSTSVTDLPADLGSERREKATAEIEVSDARRAASLLDGDVERALAALRTAQAATSDAAVAVAKDEADRLAEQLGRLQRAAFAVKMQLSGLGVVSVTVDGKPRPFPLSRDAVDALTKPAEPYGDVLQGPNGPEALATSRWIEYLAALQADPAAQLDQASAGAAGHDRVALAGRRP